MTERNNEGMGDLHRALTRLTPPKRPSKKMTQLLPYIETIICHKVRGLSWEQISATLKAEAAIEYTPNGLRVAVANVRANSRTKISTNTAPKKLGKIRNSSSDVQQANKITADPPAGTAPQEPPPSAFLDLEGQRL